MSHKLCRGASRPGRGQPWPHLALAPPAAGSSSPVVATAASTVRDDGWATEQQGTKKGTASLAWEGAAPRPTQLEEGGPAMEEELCPVIYGERKEETENLGERGGVEGVGSLIYSSIGRGGTHARAVRGPRGVAHL
jgi:hypothetical protein